MAQIFPRWINAIPKLVVIEGTALGVFAVFAIWYWFSPLHTDVGYAPAQPVPYSHKLHAGDLGIDCRYCHTGVERSPHAGVPPTQTCMNCHANVKTDSALLQPIRDSWEKNEAMSWIRIHKVPDYAYFDHSAHISVGVGCVSCHGRIDQMVTVKQEEPLSMGWCLDCHRNPVFSLRPDDKITDMEWEPSGDWIRTARQKAKKLQPPVVSCSGCHR